jgi:hypothetical protein
MTNDNVHTSFLSNVLATVIFCAPVIYFYLSGELLPLAIYTGVIIYVMVATLTRIKWSAEINPNDWEKFTKSLDFLKVSRKLINSKNKKPA